MRKHLPFLFTLAALLSVGRPALAQPITYMVTRPDDAACAADPGTLRRAIDLANSDGVMSEVRFDAGLAGQTIRLECPLQIDRDLSLVASLATPVDGSNLGGSTILRFGGVAGQTHSVTGLILRGGLDTQGIEIANGHSVTCRRCQIVGNSLTATAATPNGAGIHVDDGKLLLDASYLYNNRVVGEGGAIQLEQGKVALLRSRVDKNAAGLGGGAIASRAPGASILVDSSTFYRNDAAEGGAVAIYAGSPTDVLTVVNSTFTSNGSAATTFGGAIYGVRLVGASQVKIRMTSATFSQNRAANGSTLALAPGNQLRADNTILDKPAGASGICWGADFVGSYDIWDDTSCALGTVNNGSLPNTNPMVLPLASNGGLTPTHRLDPLSPAIDAGNPALCPPLDQRGAPRTTCWMGSYEN